jgi:hypothetical protein
MHISQEIDRIPQPYMPTPDGFERRLRTWVGLPADDVTPHNARDGNTPSKEPRARDHA